MPLHGSCTFTFQYVSIISSIRISSSVLSRNLHSNMFLLFLAFGKQADFAEKIYIPICFYYFVLSLSKFLEWTNEFTFQYVSIISLFIKHCVQFLIEIYIPICFYYFQRNRTRRIDLYVIYIPICFYYFQMKQL